MSVRNQDHPIRHIIVDGSASEQTKEFCKLYFPKVEVYSQAPMGIYKAMNFGIELVDDHSYVMFLNEADFLLGPEAISKLFSSLRYENSWTFGGTLAFSKEVERTFVYGYNKPVWKNIKMGLELIPHPSSIIPVIWLKNQGGFKVYFKIAADTEMNFRIYKKYGSPTHIQELIAAHEIGGISTVLESRSTIESRWARFLNFPFLTLGTLPRNILNRTNKSEYQSPIDLKTTYLSYRHFANCDLRDRVPLCCRRALLESG